MLTTQVIILLSLHTHTHTQTHTHTHTHTHTQLSHMGDDFEQEKGAMEETVRGLKREVGLHQLVIDTYIPDQYQQLIHSHATWNEDTGEWHLVSARE